MIDFASEDKMPLRKAAKLLGLTVHPTTLIRWATRGVGTTGKGHFRRLECWRAGTRILTSTQALRRFLEFCEREQDVLVEPRSPDRRAKESAAAAAELAAMGV